MIFFVSALAGVTRGIESPAIAKADNKKAILRIESSMNDGFQMPDASSWFQIFRMNFLNIRS
jgi:hypothetical protein